MTCWDDGEAEIIRRLLAAYGIPCQIVSDITHAVLPIAVDGLGEVRILVPAAREHEARTLLAEHRRQGLRVMRGGRRGRAQR
jgi:hypothetical protein